MYSYENRTMIPVENVPRREKEDKGELWKG
jgi:hypothetical protein